jgi:A/G-specific adenine glycosylase
MHDSNTSARLDLPLLRRRLLAWFDRHRRELPWRKDRDPYRIWLSEVMLQQTTVATVAPRFERFLQAFPTLADLAAADEQAVLREWEGLGYYRRARNLHAAARMLAAVYRDTLPDDPDVWSALPGVGRYILGAVLSQAFDRRLPIVEANSQRVICRLFGQAEDPKSGRVKNWLWQQAESLLPTKRAGDFNQALMELGALVCTPAAPKCRQCPLARQCQAFRTNRQDTIPRLQSRAISIEVREVAVVVTRKGRVLLVQRPNRGRWSNMWEFPHGETARPETVESAAKRLLRELTGIHAAIGKEVATVRHGVMRYRITLTCMEAKFVSGKFRSTSYAAGRWIRPAELVKFPVSSPQRKLATIVANASSSDRPS